MNPQPQPLPRKSWGAGKVLLVAGGIIVALVAGASAWDSLVDKPQRDREANQIVQCIQNPSLPYC